MRLGPWKWHFSTKEDYDANFVPRTSPLVFNLRMDPFESYDQDAHGHLLQEVPWMFGPIGDLTGRHLMSLAEYPPVQGGKSFVMSNVVAEFIKNRQDGSTAEAVAQAVERHEASAKR